MSQLTKRSAFLIRDSSRQKTAVRIAHQTACKGPQKGRYNIGRCAAEYPQKAPQTSTDGGGNLPLLWTACLLNLAREGRKDAALQPTIIHLPQRAADLVSPILASNIGQLLLRPALEFVVLEAAGQESMVFQLDGRIGIACSLIQNLIRNGPPRRELFELADIESESGVHLPASAVIVRITWTQIERGGNRSTEVRFPVERLHHFHRRPWR